MFEFSANVLIFVQKAAVSGEEMAKLRPKPVKNTLQPTYSLLQFLILRESKAF